MAKKSNTKKPAVRKSAAGSKNKTTNKKPVTHILVRFLNSPAGKYHIAAEVGQKKLLPFNQATEMIENGDAEAV